MKKILLLLLLLNATFTFASSEDNSKNKSEDNSLLKKYKSFDNKLMSLGINKDELSYFFKKSKLSNGPFIYSEIFHTIFENNEVFTKIISANDRVELIDICAEYGLFNLFTYLFLDKQVPVKLSTYKYKLQQSQVLDGNGTISTGNTEEITTKLTNNTTCHLQISSSFGHNIIEYLFENVKSLGIGCVYSTNDRFGAYFQMKKNINTIENLSLKEKIEPLLKRITERYPHYTVFEKKY